MLLGNGVNDWNFIHQVLVSMPIVEGVIYVLVGLAALMKIFSFKCKKCVAACAGCCSGEAAASSEGEKMNQGM